MQNSERGYYRTLADRLLERFADVPRDDRLIEHREIAAVIQEEYGSHIYRGVCALWKRLMLTEVGTVLIAIPGSGYRVAAAANAIRNGVSDVGGGLRRARRGRLKIAVPRDSELSPELKIRRDHAYRLSSRILDSGDTLEEEMARALEPKRPHLIRPN